MKVVWDERKRTQPGGERGHARGEEHRPDIHRRSLASDVDSEHGKRT